LLLGESTFIISTNGVKYNQAHEVKLKNLLFITIFTLVLSSLGFYLGQNLNYSTQPRTNQPTNQISGVKTEMPPSPQLVARQSVKVTRVIDGDTIEIEGSQRVRYIGVDTPEIVDPRSTVQCFGREASLKNRELVEGKSVILEKDISETDKYGRLLRYVYIDNLFVNDYLTREGYAHASSYPPDIKYQNQLQEAETEARQNNRGLWSACDFSDKSPQTNQQPVQSSDCLIKGNISSSGEKIYHLPGQRYYDKTVIDESKGERWFCTEEEAILAGWRKSKI